jgi:hypothetical protein
MLVDPRSAEFIQSMIKRLGATEPAIIAEAQKTVVDTGE